MFTTIGDPLESGATIRVTPGTECKPVIPRGNGGLEWRDRGLVNGGASTLDVVCPLRREVKEESESSSYLYSITLGNEGLGESFIDCTMLETVSGNSVYTVESQQRVPADSELGYTLTFPRVTPQDSVLSAYALNCALPPGGVIQQLSSIAVNQE